MTFQLPSRVPAFDSAQREIEDGYWRAATSSRPHYNTGAAFGGNTDSSGGLDLSGKIGNFINPSHDLPMYKDKPYFNPRKTGPAAARRRKKRLSWLLICVVLLAAVWWLVSGGEGSYGFRGGGIKSMHGGDLWKWVESFEKGKPSRGADINWEERRERVRDAFVVSWDSYEQDAWGKDIYRPISKKGQNMVEGGMGWIIVDALDTMIMMNLTSRVQHARNWIHTSLRYDQDHDVNTFETTIRMLGGLLSAHYLSTTYPDLAPLSEDDEGRPGEDLYLEKAADLAERLLGAFDSPSGVPYASVNLNTSAGIPSHVDDGASSTAEATSVQLEFKYLAKLTGEANYWETVEKTMEVVESNGAQDGLVPIFIYAHDGKFRGDNVRLGSRGDSYYEYLAKQYLQTSGQEPIYKDLWDEALAGIRKHLITYTKHASLTIIGERPEGLRGMLSPKMDHLVCFMPGTIALAATGGLPLSEARKQSTWGKKQEEEIILAKELTKTCWATYLATESGLAGEITYFTIDNPPRMMDDMFPPGAGKKDDADVHIVSEPLEPVDDENSAWRKDITVRPGDRHNLQRPETVESLLYMYRITGDEMYRHWGWEMFKNFVKHTAIIEKSAPSPSETASASDSEDSDDTGYITGFTSLSDVKSIPAVQRDNMESFWLAETLKYLYLLFSDRDFIPLEKTVFNTEAHPFPKFELGKMFRTGWQRKHGKSN